MPRSIAHLPPVVNEPIFGYAPGSVEREELKETLKRLKSETPELPMWIGGKPITTGNLVELRPPHERSHILCHYHEGDGSHVQQAIDAALMARKEWGNMAWEDRAAIFLKAAELISGPYRSRVNAVTMLGQSKNAFQSEIDAVCEFIDFLRYNAEFMTDIYADQPVSPPGIWNRMEYRPLEGFVFAVPPFNFTSIAGNLACAPALLGNTVVWKPSYQTSYAAQLYMEIFHEAGLPPGVINLIHVPGKIAGDVALTHPDLAGVHFTGSTRTFQHMWKTIGENIAGYRSYPRIVGETGGKDFVLAHPSANPVEVATALSRGAFEYQGQKCSAASRAYIPSNIWNDVKKELLDDLASFKMGPVENFGNFVNAVIDEAAYRNITGYIDRAKADGVEIIAGGNYDESEGWFIEPTVILADDPKYTTMCEEIFGPVLTLHVYDENRFDETLRLVDETSPYALTGSIFARERTAITQATKALENAAGNFYINDKPTGAVVNQQPFGGARASGTNDKAGSKMNLYRWLSARSIKEALVPPTDHRYPFLSEE
ncbi:MAG: L-glutamate gamma-semialdehyde dehydrogenase [Ignavibacteriae bacterium]|nr:L-glutamate gamma-semialdehyde dehydrogenase [Ignavibacteriota bacterium]MCB9216510.1 L-glutamate gamma-semialdehyde dehydrogenase [Ignavibacteria bacterium]